MLHVVNFATVYKNGWEYPGQKAQSYNDNPAQCAKEILRRLEGNDIVGIRITGIDNERIDQIFVEA